MRKLEEEIKEERRGKDETEWKDGKKRRGERWRGSKKRSTLRRGEEETERKELRREKSKYGEKKRIEGDR